jgi:GNAT superfamily N-acetyltransferase
VTRIPERFKTDIERVDPLGTDNAEAVDAFQRAHFPSNSRQVTPANRTWLFGQNPHAGEAGPAFWICRRDGRIVGQQSEVPAELKVGDAQRTASWAIDLMVDPAWRLRGVGPALVDTVLAHRPIVGVLYASEHGLPAFLKAGCVDLGPMPVYRRPLDPKRALQMPRVPAALRRLAPVLAAALRLADAVAAAATRLAGARLVPVDAFDERSDQVWEATAPAYPVLARRDLAALRWKIDQRPDRGQLSCYYLERRGRPIGYVVVRPTLSSGVRTAVVVDYLAPPRWVATLLLAAGRAAAADGAAAMSVRTRNRWADRSLRWAGFLRRSAEGEYPIHHLMHCADGDEAVAAQVLDADSWFLTAGDGDLESGMPHERLKGWS